jgi:GntR family transcriptional regulator
LSGELRYGAQLESENALVRRFDVSRNTVRKGLEALTGKGLNTTRVGIVTFVTFTGSMTDVGNAGLEQATMQLRMKWTGLNRFGMSRHG